MKGQPLPINCAGRLALWVYPRIAVSRFQNAPVVVEKTRSYERPDFDSLPGGAEVGVELWGGAVKLRVDGERRRVYTDRFDYVSFASEAEARSAFLELWRRVERSESVEDVIRAISAWRVVNSGGDQ